MPEANQSFVENLFSQYHKELHAYLVKRASNNTLDAADIAQETYLRLLRMKNVDLIEKPHAYVYRVALNVLREFALKEQGQRRIVQQLDIQEVEPVITETPDTQANRMESLVHLESIINKLPPTYRSILLLRLQYGMSYQEIANKLDLSIHTVKKYLYRAVAHCRQQQTAEGASVTSEQ